MPLTSNAWNNSNVTLVTSQFVSDNTLITIKPIIVGFKIRLKKDLIQSNKLKLN